MKMWILSSDSQIQSTKRLLEAAKHAQIETEVLNPSLLHFEFGRNSSTLFQATNKGTKKLELPDLVLPRLGWQSLRYGLRLAQFLESAGVAVINPCESLERATDKLLSLQLFHQAGLPVPKTRHSPLTMDSASHVFAKSDAHVFKTLQGSQGFGVTWSESRQQSLAQVDAYRTVQADFLVQEMIEESFGKDIRAFVINGKVVASMQRQGPKTDLRSNLHQGGKSKKVKLSRDEEELVLKATETLGLFYSGVDFLRTSKSPLLLEANPSPGFEGISETCQLDVAEILFQEMSAQPELTK